MGGGLPDLLQYYIGGGLPNLLQYYIGVGIESLLQYYSFEMKMEGFNPFSALNELKSDYFICLIWIYYYAFCRQFGKISQIRVFKGCAQIIIIVGGLFEIHDEIT